MLDVQLYIVYTVHTMQWQSYISYPHPSYAATYSVFHIFIIIITLGMYYLIRVSLETCALAGYLQYINEKNNCAHAYCNEC